MSDKNVFSPRPLRYSSCRRFSKSSIQICTHEAEANFGPKHLYQGDSPFLAWKTAHALSQREIVYMHQISLVLGVEFESPAYGGDQHNRVSEVQVSKDALVLKSQHRPSMTSKS